MRGKNQDERHVGPPRGNSNRLREARRKRPIRGHERPENEPRGGPNELFALAWCQPHAASKADSRRKSSAFHNRVTGHSKSRPSVSNQNQPP
jgi:hypothetical protein